MRPGAASVVRGTFPRTRLRLAVLSRADVLKTIRTSPTTGRCSSEPARSLPKADRATLADRHVGRVGAQRSRRPRGHSRTKRRNRNLPRRFSSIFKSPQVRRG
jgi:hypothetical protein